MKKTIRIASTRDFIKAVLNLPETISKRPVVELMVTGPFLLDGLYLRGIKIPDMVAVEPNPHVLARIRHEQNIGYHSDTGLTEVHSHIC